MQNNTEGATVQLRPRGVLPSQATMQLVVTPLLADLFGENDVGAFVEPTRLFRTEADDAPRSDALAFDFAADAALGPTDFGEAPAVVQHGALRVPDAFPAVDADVGDWVPLGSETVLRTDTQQLVYQNGVVKTFSGGVLQVRNLWIPAGCVVRGQGPNPLVIIVDGNACIEGRLAVDGADVQEQRTPYQYGAPATSHRPLAMDRRRRRRARAAAPPGAAVGAVPVHALRRCSRWPVVPHLGSRAAVARVAQSPLGGS